LELLQYPAGAFSHGAHGIVGDMNRQAGFFRHQAVDAAQQRAATGEHDPAIDQIGGELRWAAFKGNAIDSKILESGSCNASRISSERMVRVLGALRSNRDLSLLVSIPVPAEKPNQFVS